MLHGQILDANDEPLRAFVLDKENGDVKVEVTLLLRGNGQVMAVPYVPEPELEEPRVHEPVERDLALDPRRSPIDPDDFGPRERN